MDHQTKMMIDAQARIISQHIKNEKILNRKIKMLEESLANTSSPSAYYLAIQQCAKEHPVIAQAWSKFIATMSLHMNEADFDVIAKNTLNKLRQKNNIDDQY